MPLNSMLGLSMTDEFNKQIEQTIKELIPKAENGDANAQHHLFVLLFSEAMKKYDTELFNKAEKYLILSAGNGWPEAIEDMNNQELRRSAFEGRVKRNK